MEHAYQEQKAKTVEQRTLALTNQSQSIVDNRPAAIAQRKLIAGMHNVAQFNGSRLKEIEREVKDYEARISEEIMYIEIDGLQKCIDLFNYYLKEINEEPNSVDKSSLTKYIKSILRLFEYTVIVKRIEVNPKILSETIGYIFRNQIASNAYKHYLQEINNEPNSLYKSSLKRYIEKTLYLIRQKISQQMYTPTTQPQKDNFNCWFLSVFEGLRQSGLLLEIFPGVKNWMSWQEILVKDFHKTVNVDETISRLNEETTKKYFKDFFKKKLPQYEHSLTPYNPTESNRKQSILPKSPEGGSGIYINEDALEINFYIVDKPGHAMFYIGRNKNTIYVYNQFTKKNEKYKMDEINRIEKHTFTYIS